jgi:hypothetical protein
MNTSPGASPELSEERWRAWVEKGRRGDAARVQRWRVTAGVTAAVAAALGVYFFV